MKPMRCLQLCSALAIASVVTGCGSSGDKGDAGAGGTSSTGGTSSKTESVTVEVFSWWTAPGEAEALQSLMNLHNTNFPHERIYNAATDPKLVSGGVEAMKVL